ncbi:MAG: glycine zipper 2TM domain-containing protein [Desulfocapsaceae bacterium]|jgi:outer membrane lipoprotein SlyB|nr:glycine zipper 2TM domain-containing protein [Desulfocapsaceae bacterium]
MKKIMLITIISITFAVNAQASDHRHNDIRGVIVGAGGGALLGQAIGRNTQATVVGTAIGSIVGYIVGSEMDKGYGHSEKVVHYESRPVHYQRYEPVVVQRHPQTWRDSRPRSECREAEILGTINGKARKMYGTVCRTADGWQLVSQDTYHDDDYRSDSRYRLKGKKGKHDSYSRHPRWVRHRF